MDVSEKLIQGSGRGDFPRTWNGTGAEGNIEWEVGCGVVCVWEGLGSVWRNKGTRHGPGSGSETLMRLWALEGKLVTKLSRVILLELFTVLYRY